MAKDKLSTGASGEHTSIIVALMEQIEGMRSDMSKQTEAITAKMDSQNAAINTKLDQQAADNRAEFRELRDELTDMKVRLGEGSERMRNMRSDIEAVKTNCKTAHPPGATPAVPHSTTALERKARQEAETEISPRKKGGFNWKHALIVAAITGIGSQYGPVLVQKLIDSLATKPAVVAKTNP
jgi:predicted RNase H-like nuclease (RuvC/YqgF family)